MTDAKFKKKLRKLKKKCDRKKAIYNLRQHYLDCFPFRVNAKVSNIMLVTIVIMITLYTIASFILQYHTGVEISSTLTTCFYAFWGSELVALAGIKICKVRNENSSIEENDDEQIYG